MALFGKTNNPEGGFMDVIRCDLPDYLIWKWRPDVAEAIDGDDEKGRHGVNATVKENAIRYGSSLKVNNNEVAVFVYNQKDGPQQDFIEGPYQGAIKTANFPVLARIVGVGFGGATPFQAEVYFINLGGLLQIPFGVQYFDVFDPRFLDFGVPVSVRGKMTFNIGDVKTFMSKRRLVNFDIDTFKKSIKDAVVTDVKSIVTNAPKNNGIPVVQIETKIDEIRQLVLDKVKVSIESDFGVAISRFDIEAIEIAKDSDGYQQLMAVTRDIASQTVKDQAALNTENLSESMRIQRKAAEMQVEGANFAVHQLNQQTMVAKTAAESLGQLGGGGDGGGANFAGMMAGVAMGGMAGAQMGGMMGGMMQGMQQPGMQAGMTPPPPPNVQYNIAVNGQTTGPFNMDQLRQMVQSGQFTNKSMVWKAGMAGWVEAGTVQELAALFASAPPPPPPPPAQ